MPPIIKGWPSKKTWADDRAMTINQSSDNYKQGFNSAIKECEKAIYEGELCRVQISASPRYN